MHTPCREENSTYPWATVMMAVFSWITARLCITCSITNCWMHVLCLWHRDVRLLTGRDDRQVICHAHTVQQQRLLDQSSVCKGGRCADGEWMVLMAVVTNSQSTWSSRAIWWNSWQLVQQCKGKRGEKIKSHLWPLDRIWMCIMCVCVRFELVWWLIVLFSV